MRRMQLFLLMLVGFVAFPQQAALAFDSSDLDAFIEESGGRGARSGYESIGPSDEEQAQADFKRELNERLERDGAKNCASMNSFGGTVAEMDCRRMYRWD